MKKIKRSEKFFSYSKSIKIKLMISSILLLILALGFNTLLSLGSLEKIFIGSTFSKYTAIGNDLKRNIEKSIRFGKKIDKFLGMENMLQATRNHLKEETAGCFKQLDLPGIDSNLSVSIVLPDNRVAYSSDLSLVHQELPMEVNSYFVSMFQKTDQKNKLNKNHYKFEKKYYIALPIQKSFQGLWAGTIIIKMDENQIKAFLHKVLTEELQFISVILLVVLLVFLGLFFVVIPVAPKQTRFSKSKISIAILLILLCGQLSFSLINTFLFKTYYLKISHEKTSVLGTLLKEDIQYLLNKGISVQNLSMMEKMLGEIISTSPELSNITIFDSQMYPLYMANKKKTFDFKKSAEKDPTIALENFKKVKGSSYNLLIDFEKKPPSQVGIGAKTIKGFISITISPKVLLSELKGIILDSITVLVISVLFLMELLVIIFQYFTNEVEKIKKSSRIDYTAIRPAVFLYFFGQTISVSFLPLYMEQLYEPFWGLSKEMIMGLPICTTMLFGAISPLVAGPWVDKRGWHESFFTGLVLTSLGFAYTWLAPNAVHLIISRAFVGFGYGLTFMAANGFVVAYTDEDSKAQGLTRLVAGCYAGYICGSSTGGMLADRMGYNPVFIIGAVIIFLSLIYTVIFMKNSMGPGNTSPLDRPSKPAVKKGQLFKFLTDTRVLALCFLVILPSSMITVGFINYFIPIYIDSIGSTPSNIGRLLMAHGLFFIYIAPIFSKFIDNSSQKSKYILLSGAVCSFGLALFYFYGGMTTAVLSVMVLGLAGSFEASTPYALGLKTTKDLGSAKTIAILSSVEKIGQVAGPILFGWLILGQPDYKNLYFMGIAYLGIVFLFYMISRAPRYLTVQVK